MLLRSIALFLLCISRTASALCPVTMAHTLHNLANRAIHTGAFTEAVKLYDIAISKNANPRTFLLKALLLQREGRWEAARGVFREGNRRFPTDGQLLQAWGLMESRMGDAMVAVRLLRRCVVVDDSLAPVLNWKRFSAVPSTTKRLNARSAVP